MTTTLKFATFAPQTTFAAGSNPWAVNVVDVNADGYMDVVTANRGGKNVSVLVGDGRGNFSEPTIFEVGKYPTSLSVADVNKDGKADIVTANKLANNVSILLGDGRGNFADQSTFSVGHAPTSVSIGDLNGDGNADVVTANVGDDNVAVLEGDGRGNFATPKTFAVKENPILVSVVDVNGDSNLDVVTANENRGENISVLLGDGHGNFAAQKTSTVDSLPSSVSMADVNVDGKLDAIVASWSDDNVSVLLGDGLGSFTTKAMFDVGYYPSSVDVADLNGDGSADAVMVSEYNYGLVLASDGQGNFQVANSSFEVGREPQSVKVADVNGDGKPDLITANASGYSNNISVLLNTTEGTFVKPTPTTPVVVTPPVKTETSNTVNVTELATKSSSDIQAKDYMLALLSDDSTAALLANLGNPDAIVNAARWENADGSVKKEITYSFHNNRSENFTTDKTTTTLNTLDWNKDLRAENNIYKAFIDALDLYETILPVKFKLADNTKTADLNFYLAGTEFSNTIGLSKYAAQMQLPIGANIAGSKQGDDNYSWILEPGTMILKKPNLMDYYKYDNAWDAKGTWEFYTILHELGHGLGLHHPHTGILFPGVNSVNDKGTNDLNLNKYTLMSYNHGASSTLEEYVLGSDDDGIAATPMALDIAALQYLYGANTNYRTGIDSYKLNAESTDFYCIWDMGGSDSIEVSDGSFFSKNATIDLRAATIDINNLDAKVTDSSLGGYVSKISDIAGGYTIAHGVVIENAVGGSGNDLITGNDVTNALQGGNGKDTLIGGLGADILSGGKGKDVFKFNSIAESGLTIQTNDVITDFEKGDKINLSAIDANTTTKANDAFKTLELGTKDVVFKLTNALFFNTVTHILYGNNDKDAEADFSIQLSGVNSLVKSDFVL